MKAGIQGAAGLNSEGIEGFPLSLSLRCPSTLLTEGSRGDWDYTAGKPRALPLASGGCGWALRILKRGAGKKQTTSAAAS